MTTITTNARLHSQDVAFILRIVNEQIAIYEGLETIRMFSLQERRCLSSGSLSELMASLKIATTNLIDIAKAQSKNGPQNCCLFKNDICQEAIFELLEPRNIPTYQQYLTPKRFFHEVVLQAHCQIKMSNAKAQELLDIVEYLGERELLHYLQYEVDLRGFLFRAGSTPSEDVEIFITHYQATRILEFLFGEGEADETYNWLLALLVK